MARAHDGCPAGGEVAMEIGFVGLGRMGGNMTQRLIEHGHEVVAYDHNADSVTAACNRPASLVKTSHLNLPREMAT